MGDRLSYQIHADLLAQVAESEAEEAHVRRVLSAPLTEADLDAQERYKRAPACSRCESGLTHCVTPDACERAEAEPKPDRAGDLVVVWALLLGAWAATAFVLLVLGMRP